MNKKHVSKVGKYISMACLLFVCAMVLSCRDEYFYDDREPDFLGSSIYNYLEEQGNFELFLKVIDDLNYADVLRKTGSKTLFVADDDAFKQGIWDEWGFTDYGQLTAAHKKVILYGAMLDNAYLLEMLSKIQSTGANAEPVSGKCLRRVTSASVVDTIGLFAYADLPKNNPNWDIFNPESEKFVATNVRLALDATQPMMTHFIQDYLYQNGIEPDDLRMLVGDPAASWEDIYIFDKKVLRKDENGKELSDVVCKNGYVHQLDGLLIPPSNMAEELRRNADKGMLETGVLDCDALANNDSTTMLFSRMLDRYAVPVPFEEGSEIAKTFNENKGDGVIEQLYEKRYYTDASDRGVKKEDGYTAYVDAEKQRHEALGSLLFDPGWNAFKGTSDQKAKEVDMAAIFAPSDKAVVSYFRDTESGHTLINRYGANVADPFGAGLLQAIDSIPVDKLEPLVRNHMQMSFVSAVPSKFDLVVNDARDPMDLNKDDISHTMLANNGVVYVMKKLYSPARYESVIAPVMFDDTLSVIYKFIEDLDYDQYLLSMQNKFTLIATSDSGMVYYAPKTDVDAATIRHAYRFEPSVNSEGNLAVQAKVYTYDDATYNPETNTYTIDYKKSVDTRTLDKSKSNLVKEVMEYNIVLGDVNSDEDCASGKKYYMSKGYGTVMVQRGENGRGKVTAIAGGRERQKGIMIPVDEGKAMKMDNGHVIKLSTSMIQPPVQSVYDVLSTTKEYEKFFEEFCIPNDDVLNMILGKDALEKEKDKYRIFDAVTGLVRMFDTYHYTVYVPDSVSLKYAIDNEGLPTWGKLKEECDAINKESDSDKKKEMIANLKAGADLLVKFVRYHFQDNSVYADVPKHALEVENQLPEYEVNYETSALNDSTNRFCTVMVKSADYDGKQTIAVRGDFSEDLKADLNSCVNVCYVVNKDEDQENKLYNVMARDIVFGTGTPWQTWDINTSSYAVIHQINGCLKFGGEGGIYDPTVDNPQTGEKGMFVRLLAK